MLNSRNDSPVRLALVLSGLFRTGSLAPGYSFSSIKIALCLFSNEVSRPECVNIEHVIHSANIRIVLYVHPHIHISNVTYIHPTNIACSQQTQHASGRLYAETVGSEPRMPGPPWAQHIGVEVWLMSWQTFQAERRAGAKAQRRKEASG